MEAEALNIRSGPDEKYSALAYPTAGAQLKAKDVATSWLRIQPIIGAAYVASQYVRGISPEVPVKAPDRQDPLKPRNQELVPIQNQFSTEQKIMANIWNEYGGLIQQISSQFSIDPIVALAVLSVESGGKGYGFDGRLVIRFENHYFYHYWRASHQDQYQRHFKFDSVQTWKGHQYRISTLSPWIEVHTSDQRDEWQAFEFASQLERTAALKSISMGSP